MKYLLSFFLVLLMPTALAFKFSEQAEKEAAEEKAKTQRIAELLSTPCGKKLKDKKIMVVIAAQHGNVIAANQKNFSPHFDAINLRLRALGLKTYTQEEIRKQIAQGEMDAYFRNDPDAALSASKRLGASFILRGLILTGNSINPVLGINEVAMQMAFTLTNTAGNVLSNVNARADSFSNSDTVGTSLKLVNEHADEVVAQLYSDYCRNAKN